ncbi:competence/damage-inducible protein CinA [Aspergillus unguis]
MAQDFPPAALRGLTQEIYTLLKSRNETVSVAETAAGGLISSSLLSIPGASGIYKGGLTVYTLESRLAFAGWTPEHISSYKGPTPEIVAGLADHTRRTLQSTYAIGESGTAGPTGGESRNRTPGYVALAVSTPEGVETREVETGSADRAGNMVSFAEEALKLLRDVLLARQGSGGSAL